MLFGSGVVFAQQSVCEIHSSCVLAVHSCCYRANFFCAGPESKDFKFVSHIVSVATTIVSDAGEKSLRQNINK